MVRSIGGLSLLGVLEFSARKCAVLKSSLELRGRSDTFRIPFRYHSDTFQIPFRCRLAFAHAHDRLQSIYGLEVSHLCDCNKSDRERLSKYDSESIRRQEALAVHSYKSMVIRLHSESEFQTSPRIVFTSKGSSF